MMKTTLALACLIFSVVLLIPGSNGDWSNALDENKNSNWDWLVPEANKDVNQKWKVKFKNSKSAKTIHNTENTAFHHIGQSGPAGRRGK